LPPRLEVIGIEGLPEIRAGDDLSKLIVWALRQHSLTPRSGDILVISQKVVSKAEGRIKRLEDIVPSTPAISMARELGRDPRVIEVIFQESRRIVRMDRGILITETRHGLVCANAGVDQSNVEAGSVSLLPEEPDHSADTLRTEVEKLSGVAVGVIISDTFGRPWREGLTNVAIGVAGLAPLKSYLGEKDPAGHVLQATLLASADELAAASELVMGKLDRIPVALVRGYQPPSGSGTGQDLIRAPERDLFR
jgi:coenzyme F420-0:L-glutamate ligase/coenzyme F420-1:gamma-L-glutamate ligase